MLKKAGYQDQVRKLWSLKTNKNFLYDYFWFPKPKKTEHVQALRTKSEKKVDETAEERIYESPHFDQMRGKTEQRWRSKESTFDGART